MATQATLRLTSVLLLLVPFLLPLAGCDNTMPAPTKNAMPAPNEPPPTKPPAGITWTKADSGLSGNVNLASVAWSGTRYVAVGSLAIPTVTKGVIVHSTDGDTWTAASGTGALLDGIALSGVTWSGTRYVAVGFGITSITPTSYEVESVIVHSTDGDTWTAASGTGASVDGIALAGVTWSGTRYVAVGTSLSGTIASPGLRGVILHSTDGDVWTGASGAGALVDIELNGVAWSDTRFVAVGVKLTPSSTGILNSSKGVILRSTDGDTWTAASVSGALDDTRLNGVTWSGTRYVAVGFKTLSSGSTGSTGSPGGPTTGPQTARTEVIVHSTDGDTWTAASVSGALDDTELRGVTWSGTRFVAVGSNGTILTSP